MLEKLFESLDEKVFTDELKESLENQFNEAVTAKAEELAEAKAAEKIEKEIDSLNEKSEQHIDFLNEKADKYVELKTTEIVEALDKYLDRIVNEFLSEAKDALDKSVKSEKADMIIEAFDSMLIATGVEVSKIVEAKDEEAVEEKLKDSVAKNDKLVEEIITLKDENEKLIKMGVINEMKEDLSIVEAKKFEKLADLVEFTRDESFANKLETIKESIKGAAETEDKVDDITESDDTEQAVKSPAWAHLV